MRKLIALIFLLGFLSCGSDTTFDVSVATQMSPYIHRVDPAEASAGAVVTIYGFGFSSVAANNVISISGQAVFGETYSLVDPPVEGEIEAVTFTVPNGISAGEQNIFVTVFSFTSNANVKLTIE